MQTYRVYRLNPAGKIISGDWIHAPSDAAAQVKVEKLCEPGVVSVELWQGSRKVAAVPCGELEAAAGAGGTPAPDKG